MMATRSPSGSLLWFGAAGIVLLLFAVEIIGFWSMLCFNMSLASKWL